MHLFRKILARFKKRSLAEKHAVLLYPAGGKEPEDCRNNQDDVRSSENKPRSSTVLGVEQLPDR